MARKPAAFEVESVPEADKLEGFLHPRETKMLFGHRDAESEFVEGFVTGRLHHAWLIGGGRGIGKATLAYRIARFVLGEAVERVQTGRLDVVEDGRTFRQVLALSHPRLLLIRRQFDLKTKRISATIPIDEVRRVRSFLAHAAEPDAYRVVLVDQADELNGPAANALLKALEEPPTRVLFLLISSEPGRLLATIRSRCRRFDLGALGIGDLKLAVDEARRAAGKEGLAEGEWQRLAPISKGSVRRALQLSDSGGIALHERVLALLGGLPKVDWVGVHSLADEVAGTGSEQKFDIFFDLLLDAVGGMVRSRALSEDGGAGSMVGTHVIAESRLGGWAELFERVMARRSDALALNLDRRALIVETVARLQAVTRA